MLLFATLSSLRPFQDVADNFEIFAINFEKLGQEILINGTVPHGQPHVSKITIGFPSDESLTCLRNVYSYSTCIYHVRCPRVASYCQYFPSADGGILLIKLEGF